MSKKPIEVVEEPEIEEEGEESDEYEVEEEGDDDDYAEEEVEEEEGEPRPSGKSSLTALLLGDEGAEVEDVEGEEDEEYSEEVEETVANGAAPDPPSVSGVKRGRDEDDAKPEIRAGTTPDGELQGDYGEADELSGSVAASATKKARTEVTAEEEIEEL